jgi:hypothetical protein
MPTIDSIAVSVLKLVSIKMPPIFFGVWHNVVRPFTDNFGMLKIVRTSIIARENCDV